MNKCKEKILVSDFRTNLDMLKVIANQVDGTADIYALMVNWLQKKYGFQTMDWSLKNFRFLLIQLFGLMMWKYIPGRIYPANYVPEPQEIASKDDIILGVQSCNLSKEGRAYAGWEYVFPFANNRKPYLGWYDEGNTRGG